MNSDPDATTIEGDSSYSTGDGDGIGADDAYSEDGDRPTASDARDGDGEEERLLCSPIDCNDLDPCTTDLCVYGECINEIPTAATLGLLDSGSGWADIEVDLGGPGLEEYQIRCQSTRNQVTLVGHNFDDGSIGTLTGTPSDRVSVLSEADAHSSSGSGVRLCTEGTRLVTPTFDLASVSSERALLKVSLNASTLESYDHVAVEYSVNSGSSWRLLALVGDEMSTDDWNTFGILIPQDAMSSTEVVVRVIILHGPDACVDVDDFSVVALPPSSGVRALLTANFEGGVFTPFTAGLDDGTATIVTVDSSQRAQLLGRSGEYIWATADSRGYAPNESLTVSWSWRETDDVLEGCGDDYFKAQFSIDAGTNWRQMATIGMSHTLTTSLRYGFQLPIDAWDVADLRIRFISPTTSSNAATEGAMVDDINMSFEQLELTDSFGSFEDQGDGSYRSRLSTTTSGETQINCQWVCNGGLLESNTIDLSL